MNGTALASSIEATGLTLTLPTTNLGVYSTTVKIVIDQPLNIKEVPVLQSEEGILPLTPMDATLGANMGACKEEKGIYIVSAIVNDVPTIKKTIVTKN